MGGGLALGVRTSAASFPKPKVDKIAKKYSCVPCFLCRPSSAKLVKHCCILRSMVTSNKHVRRVSLSGSGPAKFSIGLVLGNFK